MKILNPFSVFLLFALSSRLMFASSSLENDPHREACSIPEEREEADLKCGNPAKKKAARCPMGTAGRSVTDPSLWYTINVPVYPATVPLSSDRNYGFAKGPIQLTPGGLIINEAGNYSVSFAAILQNNVEEYTAVIPVFITLNGTFDPANPGVGGVVTLPTGFINTVQATGILEDVPAGTALSLIATNGGSPELQAIEVIAWNISVFKITCAPRAHPFCCH